MTKQERKLMQQLQKELKQMQQERKLGSKTLTFVGKSKRHRA